MCHSVEHYLSLISHCLTSGNLPLAGLLHSRLLKSGLTAHTVVSNRLLHLYSRLSSLSSALSLFSDLPFKNLHSYNTILSALATRNLSDALHLFNQMPQRNLVSYNTLISSLARHGRFQQALALFTCIPDCRFDRFTVVAVASACAGLGSLNYLKQLHGLVVLNGMDMSLIMANVFVDGYGKCMDVESARQVFDGMGERDVVSWTSLIGAYARSGRMEEGRGVFDSMAAEVRNEVSWTALVSGHEQNGEEAKAMEGFEEMVGEGVRPTPAAIVSALSACSGLGTIGRGKEVHGHVVRWSCCNLFVYNALIDMYSKCGEMGLASKVFDSMPEHDVISWNSMVTGFAHNGLGLQSLGVFEKMVGAAVAPTHVTFLGVLSACSHAGLVSEGRRFLNLMEKEYGVSPGSEHYAALVDALGRNKQLGEAAELIESLPSTNAGIWGALLGACQVHGDLELGKRAAESLFTLEPNNGARYVTLSNIYAAAGKWEEAKRVRGEMKKKGLTKDAGFSWIEVRSVKHVFGAEDRSHCRTEEIYDMLHAVVDQMMGEKIDVLGVHEAKLCKLRIGS